MQRVVVLFVAVAALLVAAPVLCAQDQAQKAQGVQGVVKSVDASAGTITLTVKKEDKTFNVAKDVRVRIEGESKTLADVKPGARARLRLSEDGKTVLAINVGGGKKPNTN